MIEEDIFMPVSIKPPQGNNVLEVSVTDQLHKEDYEHFIPLVETVVREQGKVRVLFEMHNFHGWDMAGLWEEIKFDAGHFSDIEKLAMVGEKKWEEWMAAFCKPFTSAQVRYFDRTQIEEARIWVNS